MVRRIAKQLPIINWDLKYVPVFEGWYLCEYNTWDLHKKDYVKLKDYFFYDGLNFHTQHIYDYDGADWISKV